MDKRVHAGVAQGIGQAFAPLVLIGTTLVTPLMAQARESRDRAIEMSDPERLQPSVVAVACAAMAVEAHVNWLAIRDDRPWLDANERLPSPEKWRAWIVHRTGTDVGLGSGLGQRVVNLFKDRDMIVHFRGVPDGRGRLEAHQPPDASNSGTTAVRAYFTPERAQIHVATAEAAIAVLA